MIGLGNAAEMLTQIIENSKQNEVVYSEEISSKIQVLTLKNLS